MYKLFKYLVSVSVLIIGFTIMFTNSFLGGFFVLLSGLLVLPAGSNFLQDRLPFIQNKIYRRVATLGLFLFGVWFTAVIDIDESTKRSREREALIAEIIRDDSATLAVKNIKVLAELGSLFDRPSYLLENPKMYIKEVVDSSEGKVTMLFHSGGLIDQEASYLKLIKGKGKLQGYALEFDLNEDLEITDKRVVLDYSEAGRLVVPMSEVPDMTVYIDENVVQNRRTVLELEKIAAERAEKLQERRLAFEEQCLSGWDGSLPQLEDWVKQRMNDPESFEHVDTRYNIVDDHAILMMEYRCRNRFGRVVTEAVKVQVDLENCTLLKVLQ